MWPSFPTMRPVLLLLSVLAVARSVTLTTRGRVKNMDAISLHRFLATPQNWPDIVASSVGVQGASEAPLRKGASVDELFGLPPVLPLKVTWTCAASDERSGVLDVRSPEGLEGVASDCRMLFDVRDDDDDEGATVSLEMSYEPRSVVATLAVPVLALDNYFALNVLLQSAVLPPIDRFRGLMGSLYGVAGLAHAADCLVGDSSLLVLAGAPRFTELPAAGAALAALWCLSGPISFACSKVGGRVADVGLVQYGLVECAGAALAGAAYGGTALPNALAVQGVVALAWLYSNARESS